MRILRRALKDIAKLPKDYARLIVEHIDRLSTTPRPPDAKKLRAPTDYATFQPNGRDRYLSPLTSIG
jgi:mRNA-degrading endonuclease RelE of RelBE toxin-antitoxin system